MFKAIKAPNPIPNDDNVKIFLGGSIDMGEAEDWQSKLTQDLSAFDDVTVLNPRRDDWDSSWAQDPTPGTQFHQQVSWELDAQDQSDILVYYFADGSKSPITLLELGLYAIFHNISYTDVIVYCTPDFYRYGNVKMVCDKYYIKCTQTYEELLNEIHSARAT